MKEFKYVITDKDGIHARPAGMLVKECMKFSSDITIKKGTNSGDAKRIFAVMGLAAKKGEEITITAEGADEEQAIETIKNFLVENL
ncbi:MAG: HPr family phosphocarrier protein [Clostridia bacterium]|nr:HPr family phosphocarrier protein [Clostridia bacterium]